MSQPDPLKALHEALLQIVGVLNRPQGNRRIYRIDPAGVEGLRGYFDRFWDEALAAYRHLESAAHFGKVVIHL